jgi:hypothetical protein
MQRNQIINPQNRPSSFTDPFITNSSEEPPAITVSTNHYQLVDSVKTRRDQSNKREVFYHSHDRIFKLDLDTSAVTAVSPTQHTTICHNVWNNFLIIGTTQELIVWNMHNITPDSLQAAPMCRQMIGCMVNSINFHATESGLRLLVACNTHHPGVIEFGMKRKETLVDLCLDSIRANIVYWHEQKQIDWKRQVPDSLVDRLFFGHERQTYVEQLKRMTQARAQAATSQARTDLDRLKGRKKKNKKPNCVVN